MIELMKHQKQVLEQIRGRNCVAFYMDMGLGKTYVASEYAKELNKNILVICQKSKVNDWLDHFYNNYSYGVYDLTKKQVLIDYLSWCNGSNIVVGVINYELCWRRNELTKLKDYTLILDESSLIQHETSKRAKFIINKLRPSASCRILASGTPINGKYEYLWSQCKMLGWDIPKALFYNQYIIMGLTYDGYPIVKGYKNVERLKSKLRDYGAVFMKTEEVLDLPEQIFIDVKIDVSKEYKAFTKDSIVTVENTELVGDTTLTALLYSRMLCGAYSSEKLEAFSDLLDSTNDKLIVFYNFKLEKEKLIKICEKFNKPISKIDGSIKDLTAYENETNAVTLVQYQAGAYGLNLQKANKIIYYSPPLSSELYEQSKKRIHRIGQNQPCFYYRLKCGIEKNIYDTLEMRKDYTEELFKQPIKEGTKHE